MKSTATFPAAAFCAALPPNVNPADAVRQITGLARTACFKAISTGVVSVPAARLLQMWLAMTPAHRRRYFGPLTSTPAVGRPRRA